MKSIADLPFAYSRRSPGTSVCDNRHHAAITPQNFLRNYNRLIASQKHTSSNKMLPFSKFHYFPLLTKNTSRTKILPLGEFHHFPLLPLELRSRIWVLSLPPPRLVDIFRDRQTLSSSPHQQLYNHCPRSHKQDARSKYPPDQPRSTHNRALALPASVGFQCAPLD